MTYSPQRLDGLRLRHLRLLELIDEHQSLRAVGICLNRTQPAVSQMVKDLEYALGVELVERSVRGVALSAAGRLALQRARSGLAAFDHLVEELHTEQSPVLRVGTNPALMFQFLPTALRVLDAENVNVRFRLQNGIVGDMLHALWNGDLDCYVGRVDWDRMPDSMISVLRYDPLIQTDLVLACSTRHPLAGRADVGISDILDCSWVLPPADSNNRIALDAGLRRLGVACPTPIMEIASDPGALTILARELDVITCVPRLMLDTHIAAGELHALDLPSLVLPPIQIGFVTLAEHEGMASLRILRKALRVAAGADVAGD